MKIHEDNFIEQLKKSNSKALDYVIEQYGPLLKAVINKVLSSFNDEFMIEECLSDTLIAVWNNIDKFNPDKGSFKSWICTIAKFKAIDVYRLNKNRLQHEEIPDNLSSKMTTEDQYIINEDNKSILKLIDELDEPDRTIFIMKFLLCEPTKKISEAVKMTTNAVNVRICRTREKLKKSYQTEVRGEA